MSKQRRFRAVQIDGGVSYPEDLQPAIDQLGEHGLDLLNRMKQQNNGQVTPDMIAQAADIGRLYGEP